MEILIIDDELNSLHLFLDNVINKTDISYKFFNDEYKNVLDYLKEHKVQGVFLDINMPRINGLKLAEMMIEIQPTINIVFFTGLNIKMDQISQTISKNVVGILYKPFNELELDKYISLLAKKERRLTIKTFGSFDCFINNNIITFSSSKSKELLALLVAFNGQSITMDQVIGYLWPDRNIEKAKISYRDAVWRLRQTLDDLDIKCVIFQRALLALDKSMIDCDYFDALDKKITYVGDQFMLPYEWAQEFEVKLFYVE